MHLRCFFLSNFQCVRFLVRKSGRVNFLTNLKSVIMIKKGFSLLLDTGCQSCQQQLRQISMCPEPFSDFDCQHQSSDSTTNSNGVGLRLLMAIPNHITGSLMAHDSKVELNPMATQQRTYITRKVVASIQVTCIIKRNDIADQVRDKFNVVY